MPEYTKGSFTADGVRAFDPAGTLTDLSNRLFLSQAVVLPADVQLVVTSGQCGFREDGSLPADTREQVLMAFANADQVLREAGCKNGLKNVYQITLFYPWVDSDFVAALREAWAKYLGDNRPAQTGVAVAGLYLDAVIEITCYAYLTK